MHKRPLVIAALFFMLGIVLARRLPGWMGVKHVFIITLFLTLISFLSGRWGRISKIFLILSIVFFAALLYIKSNTFPDNHISHVLKEKKVNTAMTGVIKSPALTRRPYYGKICSTYLFEVESIKSQDDKVTRPEENTWLNVQGLAQIRIQTEKDYRYGDRLLLNGTIRKPALPKGKKEFNYKEHLERQNIFALINTKEKNVTLLAHDYKSNPILKYTYLLREKLKNQIIKKMPLDTGAFLRAILLGDRSELPKDIQENFKRSGTMHILPTQCREKYSYSLNSLVTLCKSIS